MTDTRFISPDITAAIDRWVGAIGTPGHQAASEALDDILERLCQDREAWGQALSELVEARHVLVNLANAAGPETVATLDEHAQNVIAEARKEQEVLAYNAKRTREWLEREGYAIAAAAKRGAAPTGCSPSASEAPKDIPPTALNRGTK